MKKYNPQALEQKWQKKWATQKLYQADNVSKKPKFYCLDMFPYPSAEGLHVGHLEGYTATDIISRYLRMKGKNVLHPIGWDAFGLPAENYAIKKGVHPHLKTQENIKNFRRQCVSLGLSYDWSREVDTSSPDYYKWTQWLFLQLYKKDLAYKKKAPVNWCENCKTVLANEQVIAGQCERCENEVIQKDLEQWFFRVTAYADELLRKIDELDWSDALKITQKNWIGRSEGVEIEFRIHNLPTTPSQGGVKVFTTRPDTLFGATYLVLAPEHPLIRNQELGIRNWSEIERYIQQAQRKSQLERTDLAKEKTGVELQGVKAINPATQKEIPIWVADYVLMNYGTGAIMAVPAHDERDWEFAKRYSLPIVEVISGGEKGEKAYTGEGVLVNSGQFIGQTSQEVRDKITKFVGGQKQVQYKIRDWLISRQRYWGAPIPIIYCGKCGEVPVPQKDLPVLLPDDVDFKPTGESPLVRSKKFHQVRCPNCGAKARRESDTMDTFVCSSWYFFRYCDPENKKEPFAKNLVKYWMPVDLYVGGMEHAVGHLIYSRFITKVLRDLGYLKFDEPFLKIRNQGLILAEDGRKMSKRWGNVINPDEVVAESGADAMRMYEMFMGPFEDHKPWSKKGIIGLRRFSEKVEKIIPWTKKGGNSNCLENTLHKSIKKVGEDIEGFRFNTAISCLMELVNFIQKPKFGFRDKNEEKNTLDIFLKLFSPFAPHLAEELWERLGHKKSIFFEKWPEYEADKIRNEKVNFVVQINGKVRGKFTAAPDITEAEAKKLALEVDNIKKYIKDEKDVVKAIFVKGKLINFVVRT